MDLEQIITALRNLSQSAESADLLQMSKMFFGAADLMANISNRKKRRLEQAIAEHKLQALTQLVQPAADQDIARYDQRRAEIERIGRGYKRAGPRKAGKKAATKKRQAFTRAAPVATVPKKAATKKRARRKTTTPKGRER